MQSVRLTSVKNINSELELKWVVHLKLELSKDTTNRDVSQAKPRPMGGDSLVKAVVVG